MFPSGAIHNLQLLPWLVDQHLNQGGEYGRKERQIHNKDKDEEHTALTKTVTPGQ